MTREEAAELVLGARAWRACSLCQGMGSTLKPTVEKGDLVMFDEYGKVVATQRCGMCKGYGGFVEESYTEACRVLDLKIPDWVWEKTAFCTAEPRMTIGVITDVEEGGLVKVRHDMDVYSSSGTADFIYKTK